MSEVNPHMEASSKTYHQAYCEKNKAVLAVKAAERYQKNRARLIAKSAEHYLANRASTLSKRADYYAKNYELVIVQQHNRQAKKRGEEGRLSLNVISMKLEAQHGLCVACKKTLDGDFDIDHITPTSKGGPNVDTNVQLLHSSCNAKNGASPRVSFLNDYLRGGEL